MTSKQSLTEVLSYIATTEAAKRLRSGNPIPADAAIALMWVTTAGECDQYGMRLESQQRVNREIVMYAIPEAVDLIKRIHRALDSLASDVEESDTSEEREEYVCGPIEARMKIWSFSIGLLNECESGSYPFPPEADSYLADLEALDRRMSREPLLQLVAETHTLQNMRRQVAGYCRRYQQPLPWWLDGRLEGPTRFS